MLPQIPALTPVVSPWALTEENGAACGTYMRLLLQSAATEREPLPCGIVSRHDKESTPFRRIVDAFALVLVQLNVSFRVAISLR
jgi:hypothetical protein